MTRIPVILAEESLVISAQIFDQNSWNNKKSKLIIQSCLYEHSALLRCESQIKHLCSKSDHLCQKQIERFKTCWGTDKSQLKKTNIFAQSAGLHIHIEAFFSGIKTLLDLLVQLITSEQVVTARIHGFHEKNNTHGGKILNILDGNAVSDKKQIAKKIHALITEHKKIWIDQAISVRNGLIHPEKGMSQIMFQLEFIEQGNSLVCEKIHPPAIEEKPIDQYAEGARKNIQEFAGNFLELLNSTS